MRRLRVLAGGSEREGPAERQHAVGVAGVPVSSLDAQSGLDLDALVPALRERALVDGTQAWHLRLARQMEDRILDALHAWRAAHPTAAFAPPSVCRSAIPGGHGDALHRVLLDRPHASGRLARRNRQVAILGEMLLPGHAPTQHIALHTVAVAAAGARLIASYAPPRRFTVPPAIALLGSTRKFAVPHFEHLHASGARHQRGDLHAFVGDNASGGV